MTSMAERAAERVRVLLDLDRHEDAAQAARDGLQSDPNNAELLGLLAFALYADGHVREARKWADRSLAIDPNQAEVLDIRARAIINGAGKPREAVESAQAAVRLDRTHAYYRYTLTRAQLEAKQREAAQSTADSIRTVTPASPLGPLSQALVEIDRAKYIEVRKVSLFLFALASAATRGAVLVIWAIMWLVVYFRRRGPLRRADAYLMEALRLNPGDAYTHRVAADVAHYRFRFIRAVDSTLASAAINAHMVDATELARGIVRRTSAITAITFAVWLVLMLSLFSAIPSPVVMAILGAVLVIAAAAGVTWLYEEQTKRLPPGVLRLVRRHWGLPATVFVMGAGVSACGLGVPNQPGIAIPAFAGAAFLLIVAGVLTARLVSARRR